MLRISFTAMIALGLVLALAYKHIVPLTITCLTSATALGLELSPSPFASYRAQRASPKRVLPRGEGKAAVGHDFFHHEG